MHTISVMLIQNFYKFKKPLNKTEQTYTKKAFCSISRMLFMLMHIHALQKEISGTTVLPQRL